MIHTAASRAKRASAGSRDPSKCISRDTKLQSCKEPHYTGGGYTVNRYIGGERPDPREAAIAILVYRRQKNCRLKYHAARDLDALGINPAIVFGEQRSDHRAYVIGLADAAERG